MIQMTTQNFMDVLRKKKDKKDKKKDEDYTTASTDAEDITDFLEQEEATDAGITQETRFADEGRDMGRSGKEIAEDEERKKQKLIAAKEARETNLRLWKELLEEFSKHGDIKNENMTEIVSQFSKSFLRQRKTSAIKVMDFYRSLVPKNKNSQPTADPALLELFYERPTVSPSNISGDSELLDRLKLNELEEKEYNGKKSLEILRDFLDAVSDVRGSALRGNVMTREKLDRLNRLLLTGMKEARITDVEDIKTDSEGKPLELDDEGNPVEPDEQRGFRQRAKDKKLTATKANLDNLLESFRIIIISLSKVKRQLERNVKKSIDSEDTNYDFYADIDFQRAREKTSRLSILPEETTDRVDYLIDKVEEIYNTTVELIERLEDGPMKKKAEKNKRVMKNLVDTMIGDYEFPIENNKKRAIKIN